MTVNQFALFQKDFKLLFRLMLGALGIQVLMIVIVNRLVHFSNLWFLQSFQYLKVFDWAPKLQIAMTSITALIAAAYWSAEERAGGHDAFLKRLPIGRARLWTEKTAAGLSIVTVFIIVQLALYFTALLFGIRLWHRDDPVISFLCAYGYLAFVIGLPISRMVNHPITVIVLGLTILYLGMWGLVLPMVGFVAVTGIGYWIATSGMRIDQGIDVNRSFWVLVVKQLRELILFLILSVVLFSVTLILAAQPFENQTPSMRIAICSLSVLLSMVLGIATYQTSEKDGLRCMIYHYPISRSHLYWSKFLVGFIAACMLAISITIVFAPELVHNFEHELKKTQNSITIQSGFIYIMVFMIGLLPFCCGVLITHTIRNPIYAFFETILALTIVLAVFLYLQFYRYTYQIESNLSQLIYVDLGSTFPCIVFFLIVGLSLAGWRAATDRGLLSSTVPARHVGVTRLLFFTLAVVVILVKTGWKDLLYLVTNINLGIG